MFEHLRAGFNSIEDYENAPLQLEYFKGMDTIIKRVRNLEHAQAETAVLLSDPKLEFVTIVKRNFKKD